MVMREAVAQEQAAADELEASQVATTGTAVAS
jgi:hypothetical protein